MKEIKAKLRCSISDNFHFLRVFLHKTHENSRISGAVHSMRNQFECRK